MKDNIKEKEHFRNMCFYEDEFRRQGYKIIAGIDEAGRGSWAGPVVAGLVILPEDVFIEGLDDSKKLTAKKREELYEEIIKKALDFSLGISHVNIIDSRNILRATYIAMEKAVKSVKLCPDMILIDGRPVSDLGFPQLSIIKGDSKSISIAAASIIAKVTRDRYMKELAPFYPGYGFEKHKGYGTGHHRRALQTYGVSAIHRKSFKPVRDILRKAISNQQLAFS
ncbi:MAG TPA: ribonuclease HII [Candidatus Eremiobacteraeota bacterium]|nr:ribonuclease HII [Candidatus Eremiobacteraeota bacterium]